MMKDLFERIIGEIDRVVLGKKTQIGLALTCLFSRGHLLIEDIPGIGKTTLAQALAKVLGLSYTRVQFTNDLLPGDILGVSIYSKGNGTFAFHPGPIFTQVFLADEINRATPRTQSALLEAMGELQVSVDGETRPLARPFFVIATQNPIEQSGTYSLPDSQLDRFLMRIDLGYPDREAEKRLLSSGDSKASLPGLPNLLDKEKVRSVQQQADRVHASPALLDYVLNLAQATRDTHQFITGLSPRAGLGLLAAARTHALVRGRDLVLPEDVQAVFPFVAGHRLRKREDAGQMNIEDLREWLTGVPVP